MSLGSPWYWIEAPGWARHPHHSADEVVVGLYHFVDRIFHERFNFWKFFSSFFLLFLCSAFALFWMILESRSFVLFFVSFFCVLLFMSFIFWVTFLFPRHPCHSKNGTASHVVTTWSLQHSAWKTTSRLQAEAIVDTVPWTQATSMLSCCERSTSLWCGRLALFLTLKQPQVLGWMWPVQSLKHFETGWCMGAMTGTHLQPRCEMFFHLQWRQTNDQLVVEVE